MLSVKGIDISKHQGVINWGKVAESGIEFAMIRVGYGSKKGTPTLDTMFDANMSGAMSAGIAVGVYLYSYAIDEVGAKIEADFVLDNIGKYRDKIVYPVAYDIEDTNQASLSTAMRAELCRAFCETIASGGYRPAIYTFYGWVKNGQIPTATISKYDLWLAHWTTKLTYTGDVAMWQYSDQGKVPGINGNVDMNLSYRDYKNPVRLVLQSGSRGAEVYTLQKRLNEVSPALSSKLKLDGVFGALTETAVCIFQQKMGLQIDGIVGARTYEKLGFGAWK